MAGKIVILSSESSAGRTLLAWKLFDTINSREEDVVHLLGYDLQKPDLLPLLETKDIKTSDIHIQVPRVDKDRCRFCGACITACDCGALHIDRNIPALVTDPEKCEACGDCEAGCNLHGISYRQRLSGQIQHYHHNNTLISIGAADEREEFLLPLICSLNKMVKAEHISICDTGPGMGGDVLTTLRDADFAIVLVNPEEKWNRNLDMVIERLKEREIKFGLLVNKYRKEKGFIEEVEDTCLRENIPFLGTIPFMSQFEKLEKTFDQEDNDPKMASIFAAVWDKISLVVS